MLIVDGAQARIVEEVGCWPGVDVRPHRFGGVEFAIGRRELGHLHGDTLADLPFTRAQRDELLASGMATKHHFLPDSGWVSRRIRSEDDVTAVIGLLRLQYERVIAKRSRARATT